VRRRLIGERAGGRGRRKLVNDLVREYPETGLNAALSMST